MTFAFIIFNFEQMYHSQFTSNQFFDEMYKMCLIFFVEIVMDLVQLLKVVCVPI